MNFNEHSWKPNITVLIILPKSDTYFRSICLLACLQSSCKKFCKTLRKKHLLDSFFKAEKGLSCTCFPVNFRKIFRNSCFYRTPLSQCFYYFLKIIYYNLFTIRVSVNFLWNIQCKCLSPSF